MTKLKHIMAAADLSIISQYAVERGYHLAKISGAQYTLIHALGLESMQPLRKLLGEDIEAVSEKTTENATNQLIEMSSYPEFNLGLVARLQVERGAASSTIPEFVAANDVDLMLIGTHGKDFLERVLSGSTTSRLIQKESMLRLFEAFDRAVYRA